MKSIVIGVDGSETANEALTLAAREAELHDARLRIVVVWQLSSLVYGGGFVAFDEETYGALRDRAQSIADAAGAAVAELAPAVDRGLFDVRTEARPRTESHDGRDHAVTDAVLIARRNTSKEARI